MQVKHRVQHHSQRGATMVSVMLLTVSLMTVALLVVRSSSRELKQAGALVQRERALLAAQATLDLASARYRRLIENVADVSAVFSGHLVGQFANSTGICDDIEKDCIPGEGDVPRTGQRNTELTGNSQCAGRPCMRPGAVVVLPGSDDAAPIPWVNTPLAGLIAGGDADAAVSLWIRNNTADALRYRDTDPGAHWTQDRDSRVVLTAMATVNNTTVAVEQEISFAPGPGLPINNMATPDEGYGGGHNNDNASIRICEDDFL